MRDLEVPDDCPDEGEVLQYISRTRGSESSRTKEVGLDFLVSPETRSVPSYLGLWISPPSFNVVRSRDRFLSLKVLIVTLEPG